MADDVPTALKQADLNLFKCAQRGAQLQSIKPIITYWCNYWVVNQILAKGIHNTDAEILEYTTKLMDKLEETKAAHSHEDAILDDAAGQAYVEQFAQETLDRAQRVVKANKVTVQTGQTFDAAATFINLANIWGPLDTENLQKIKYAKWNAARIYKAIKEGKDPNESNPKPEELPEQPPMDLNDPEVQLLTSPGSGPKPVSVEDVPDTEMRRDSAGVSLPHSPVSATHSATAPDELTLPSIPPTAPGTAQAPQPGYFDNATPQMPSPMSPPSHNPVNYQQPSVPPTAPGWVPTPSPPPNQPAFSPPPISQPPVTSSASIGPPTFASNQQPTPAVVPPPMSISPDPSYMNMAPTASTASTGRPPIPAPSIPSAPYHAVPPAVHHQGGAFVPDDAAMAAAQKHAKWAISALNFEDVTTAVRELENALARLRG